MPIVHGKPGEERVNTWLAAAWIVGAVVFVTALWMGIASAVWGLQVATAGVYGRGQAHRQIQSASFRIASYEHFFNLCASVQTNEAQLAALRDELARTTNPKDVARINANITGVTAARGRAVLQYNVDARKDYTAGQFRDSDLPYQLDLQAEGTSCGDF